MTVVRCGGDDLGFRAALGEVANRRAATGQRTSRDDPDVGTVSQQLLQPSLPADGFFEWLHVDRKKVLYLFRPRDGGYLGFADIWDIWQSAATDPLYSCAIVTVTANATLRPYRERLPAILIAIRLRYLARRQKRPRKPRTIYSAPPTTITCKSSPSVRP